MRLTTASPIQLQLISVGSSVSRSPCPLRADAWERLLTGYVPDDPCYTAPVLVAGIRNGSYVRFEGDRTLTPRIKNHPAAVAHSADTAALILQEVRLGRMLGPFDPHNLPLQHVRLSPLNIVPKKESWRLINDLSSPRGSSVNDGIYNMPTKWQLIQHALQLIVDTGVGCHLGKMDVKAAFRLLPIHPTDWHLFGCKVEGLCFVDTYLPFGGRSSGNIWERYAQAMQWMLVRQFGIPPTARWVDDFLFVLRPAESVAMMARANAAFAELGVPMDPNKEEGPTTSLVYMGYTLDTVRMTVGTSPKHREKLTAALQTAIGRSVSVEDLESLIGKLEFVSIPLRLGRSYLFYTRRELYAAQHRMLARAYTKSARALFVHLHANSKASTLR